MHRAFVRSIWAVHREQQNFPGVGIAAAVMGLARLGGCGASLRKQDLSHVRHGVRNQQSFFKGEYVVPGPLPVSQANGVVVELGVQWSAFRRGIIPWCSDRRNNI